MYTIKQAAARSGVNVSLLRAWERRYGVVSPARTDSGYRLYDDDAIDRLRAMRALVDAGWSARQAAERVADADPADLAALDSLIAPASATDASHASDATDASDPTRGFVAAAARIDATAIEQALDDMFAGGSFERVIEDRLFPALRALGDAWASGEVDVAGEHAASAAAVRRLGIAYEAAGSPAVPQAPVLVGLPAGTRHEVAALAFATSARRAGLAVVYLGADVPVDSWVAAVERTGARGVAFGVVMATDVAAADAVVRALRAAHPELAIAVGGMYSAAVGDGDVVRLPDRLGDAVEVLHRALG